MPSRISAADQISKTSSAGRLRKEKKDCDPAVDGTPYALDILREGEAAKGTVAEARCFTSPARWGQDAEALAKIPQCQ